MVVAQARTEIVLALRNGEQVLVSLGIPLLVLVFFSTVEVLPLPEGVDQPVDFLAPGVLALTIMSTAMVSLGIGTGFERSYGVLKRLGATPLGRPRWVAAKILMVLAVQALALIAVGLAAIVLGWRPDAGVVALPVVVVAGTAAFAGIGLAMAGTLRGPATLAAANGLYLVLLLVGGMVIPLDSLPGGVEAVARLLPAAALSEVTGAVSTAGTTVPVGAAVVLAVWALGAPALAAATFRWE
ncbi:MAG: ABC transporter permease [Acidimicrobiia bacterium]|nr:ABC transporter permease [Acidimicrobiia bacterium]